MSVFVFAVFFAIGAREVELAEHAVRSRCLHVKARRRTKIHQRLAVDKGVARAEVGAL